MNFFVHEKGICESSQIGKDTKIWAFAHVLAEARIGDNCNICDHVFIENDVVLGNNITIKCGVQVWDGITIEDNAFIGPNVTFTNDPYPRSKKYPDEYSKTLVRNGASIGANATILPGLNIGKKAMIGAGAVVTTDVPDYAIVTGNPARVIGFSEARNSIDQSSQINGIKYIDFSHNVDARGTLVFGETDQHLPFAPERFFYLTDLKDGKYRANHAHRVCTQIFLNLRGSTKIFIHNHTQKEIHTLREGQGLIVPPLHWVVCFNSSPNDLIMVLNSHKYDKKDYIQCSDEFSRMVMK